LQSRGTDADRALVEAAEHAMVREKIPIERFFRRFRHGAAAVLSGDGEDVRQFCELLTAYEVPSSNAAPIAECGMLIDEVEAIWSAIDQHDDWGPLHRKIENVRTLGTALRTDNG
jgi:serine/tyrosine/threonine adenylyltransferase